MEEIQHLLSKALKTNKQVIKGQEFSVEAHVTGKEDYINLYAGDTVIAVYDKEDQDLNILNYKFKKAVKYFGECLEEVGMEVYIDEGLMD
jgi:predicted regulator of Ras-like GTPase activity (Roadblock/LC7/MglB family)